MSPQGFAKAIHSLEKSLGVPLFERDESGRRRTTPYADELYQYARHLQVEWNLLQREFDRMKETRRASIRVASALGVTGIFGLNFAKKFMDKHPDIDLSVTEMPDAMVDRMMLDGLFDLALSVAPVPAGLTFTPLYSVNLECWIRDDHPLADKQILTAQDLSEASIATPGPEHKVREGLANMCRQAQVEPPRFFDCYEIFWIYDFVLKGEGLGITLPHIKCLPMFNLDTHVKSIPIEGLFWTFGVSHTEEARLREHENVFVEHMKLCSKKLMH